MQRRALPLAFTGSTLLGPGAFAQDPYPSKVVTWICPCAADGHADNRSRQIARWMGQDSRRRQ